MFEKIVQRGTLLTVAVLIICVLGVIAALRIPVQMIPDLDVRVISVRTNWPGATPQDVEKEILIEQEDHLRNLPSLTRIVATARSGRAGVQLEFPFGTDITEMLIRVNNALSQVPSYPENVKEPRIYASSFSSNSFMFFRVAPLPGNPRQLDMHLTRDFIENTIKPRMASVAGVSEINTYGGAERQIQILVDPAKLAQRKLSLSDIRQAIRARNRDRSGGEIESGKRRYLLRTVGRFEDLEQLRSLILKRQGDAVIRLHDVARVQLDHFEASSTAFVNYDPVIFLTVKREAGSNVIDIKRAMMAQIAAINREIAHPAGMDIKLVADDVRYVNESIGNVWQNLCLGALLATAVMFLFLRSKRTTVVGVIGIPICTIAAFLGLLLAGRTINVISLAGIAFAIGMTLDNSIVVLESIELERRRGNNGFRAAIDGVKKVWPAVLASTLTTVLVFLPVAFVAQEAGQLYSDIAIAISTAILTSMLVAITVVPTAAARLHPELLNGSKASDSRWRQGSLGAVAWLLASARRRWGCILATCLLSVTIIATLTPPAEYLPEGEEPKTFANMNAPPGYNLKSIAAIGEEVRAFFVPFVEDTQQEPAPVGATPQALVEDSPHSPVNQPPFLPDADIEVPPLAYLNTYASPERLRIIAEPKNSADIDKLMDAIRAKYKTYPGMRTFVTQGSIITSNDGGSRSINVDISGPDLNDIYQVARATYSRAQEVFATPRIRTQPSSLSLAQPLVEVRPNWDRAAELGMTTETLGFTVSALTDGSYVDEFFLADDKIDMYLYSDAGQNASLDSLPHLPVYTPAGTVLPLSSLVEIVETVDTSSVRRVNGRRTVTLNIIPPRKIPLETGVEIVSKQVIEELRARGEIPNTVNITLSGAADQLGATRDALTENYLVALVVIYLLLVAIFTHWGYPLLIMTTIPLGIAAGIVGLWLLNTLGGLLPLLGLREITQPFDMISMLGFLILMGTVVNNPILIVHRAVDNVNKQAMAIVPAVQEAIEARLRPIAMSTITTICGLAPLVMIPGAGTELYRGVGAIVMFGILGAALVSLTMLPALTVVALELGQRYRRLIPSADT